MSVASEQKSPRRRSLRWIRWTAYAATPFLALYVLFMAPMWANDFRVARLIDRVLNHPLPPETTFGLHDPQGEVSGDSSDCEVDIRFDLYTDRPTEEVLAHYRAAEFAKGGGEFSDMTIGAWVPFEDSPAPARAGREPRVHGALIISLGASYPGGSTRDLRCW
ncbi:hypothetical protein ACQEVF_00370 [Nonomuraea polychroma]|uniref:hypothetical protein n=1 Tax=Nonomuraea polychroma TaxID=46176 RepID=UPI003D8B69A0